MSAYKVSMCVSVMGTCTIELDLCGYRTVEIGTRGDLDTMLSLLKTTGEIAFTKQPPATKAKK